MAGSRVDLHRGPRTGQRPLLDPRQHSLLVWPHLNGIDLTLGMLYLSLQALKRWKGWMPRSTTRQIMLRETLSLGPRRALHLVQVGEQQFLIAATDHQVTLISAVPPVPPNRIGSL